MFSSTRFLHSLKPWAKASVSLVAAAGIVASSSGANCQAAPTTPKEEVIAVYLKPESKVMIEKFLVGLGYKDHTADYVVIHGAAKESSSYVFRPLFGERAAFRLKGLLLLENGGVVGIGRVSNMVGELRDDDRIVAMPVLAKGMDMSAERRSDHPTPELQTKLDAPSRLFFKYPEIMNKPYWKGRIPAGKVDKGGVQYPAMAAEFLGLSTAQQPIVEGYLCSSTHYCAKEGRCTYDRSLEVEHSVLNEEEVNSAKHEAHSSTDHTKAATTSTASTASESTEANKECPICKYMKNGPCKDEFIAWDGCLTSLKEDQELHDCFQHTKMMMFCMRNHEYYDIMSAGTDYSKLEAADQAGKVAAAPVSESKPESASP